jgi:hypothetical protein
MVRCKPAAAASMMACALLLLLLLAVHQHSAALPAPTAPALDPNGRLYARMAGVYQMSRMQSSTRSPAKHI